MLKFINLFKTMSDDSLAFSFFFFPTDSESEFPVNLIIASEYFHSSLILYYYIIPNYTK